MYKKALVLLLVLSLLVLSGCVPVDLFYSGYDPIIPTLPSQPTEPVSSDPPITNPPVTEPPVTEPPVTQPPVTEPPVTVPPVTEAPQPQHSDLYIPGFSTDDVIRYFTEVCLDAEYSSGPGDARLLQKWDRPLLYYIHGNPTQKDLEVIGNFTAWLNRIEGFPGMYAVGSESAANLQIYFCNRQELIDRMGSDFSNADGSVNFTYYTSTNNIFQATICYRNDIDQYVRNSVLLEEIYNGLGPAQDTELRTDSLIYAGYSTPQWLTAMDELIIKLMYHPLMTCGMNAQQCAAVIRELYY